jgi:predicted phage terminase large subunit-like protein
MTRKSFLKRVGAGVAGAGSALARIQIHIPGEGDTTLDDLRAELARRSLREFTKQAWKITEPAKPFIGNWHIDAICEHLQAVSEGKIRKLLITVPPGHAKSLLVSVMWPAWQWLRKPQWRALFTSYSSDLANRDSMRCRAIIESPWYRETFRPEWSLSTEQNVKSWFDNTERGFRMSISVGGAGTGFRGDAVIVDDPLNAKDQHSQAALNAITFWWDQVMSSRLDDMSKGAYVMIMQRLSERDLAAHVLAKGGFDHLNLPSQFETNRRAVTSIGWKDPRKDEGELLFPALFPKEVIEEAKITLGSQGFAAQHQQRPAPAEGGILKRFWWRYWKPRDWKKQGLNLPPVTVRTQDGNLAEIEAVELPETFETMLQSWDCTFKEKKTSDFVTGVVMAKQGANRFLLDLKRDRMDLPKTMDAITKMTEKWPKATAKLVEDAANGPAVIQMLGSKISGLIPVNPEGGKMSRAAAVSPEVEAGNWFLPHPSLAPWVADFIEECAAFPNGKNDDQVDAWSQGGNRLRSALAGLFPIISIGKSEIPPSDRR